VKEGRRLLAVNRPAGTVDYTFHGSTAAAVEYDGAGWRRELKAGSEWVQTWPERRTRNTIYFSIALSPDGAKAAMGRTQCTVELLDWPGGGPGATLQPPSAEDVREQRVYALAFSPDGKLLAAAAGRSGFVDDPAENWFGRNGGLYLYDVASGECVAAFPMPEDDLLDVVFSPDGELLFAGNTDCTVRVFDVSARKELAVLSGHMGGVNALAFSPDGQTLASAGGDGLVRLWPWRQLLDRPEKATTSPKRKRGK
jgi:WD40 repeat protein